MGGAVSANQLLHLPEEISRDLFYQLTQKKFRDEAFDILKDRMQTISRKRMLDIVSTSDVYLSFEWGIDSKGRSCPRRVQVVRDYLEAKGLFVFVEDGQFKQGGSLQTAQCFVPFFTARYFQKLNATSDNQQRQEYNEFLKCKGERFMLPVVFEKQGRLDGKHTPADVRIMFQHRFVIDLSQFEKDEPTNKGLEELYQLILRTVTPLREGGPFMQTHIEESLSTQGHHLNYLRKCLFDSRAPPDQQIPEDTLAKYAAILTRDGLASPTQLQHLLSTDPQYLESAGFQKAHAGILQKAVRSEIKSNFDPLQTAAIDDVLEKQRVQKALEERERIAHHRSIHKNSDKDLSHAVDDIETISLRAKQLWEAAQMQREDALAFALRASTQYMLQSARFEDRQRLLVEALVRDRDRLYLATQRIQAMLVRDQEETLSSERRQRLRNIIWRSQDAETLCRRFRELHGRFQRNAVETLFTHENTNGRSSMLTGSVVPAPAPQHVQSMTRTLRASWMTSSFSPASATFLSSNSPNKDTTMAVVDLGGTRSPHKRSSQTSASALSVPMTTPYGVTQELPIRASVFSSVRDPSDLAQTLQEAAFLCAQTQLLCFKHPFLSAPRLLALGLGKQLLQLLAHTSHLLPSAFDCANLLGLPDNADARSTAQRETEGDEEVRLTSLQKRVFARVSLPLSTLTALYSLLCPRLRSTALSASPSTVSAGSGSSSGGNSSGNEALIYLLGRAGAVELLCDVLRQCLMQRLESIEEGAHIEQLRASLDAQRSQAPQGQIFGRGGDVQRQALVQREKRWQEQEARWLGQLWQTLRVLDVLLSAKDVSTRTAHVERFLNVFGHASVSGVRGIQAEGDGEVKGEERPVRRRSAYDGDEDMGKTNRPKMTTKSVGSRASASATEVNAAADGNVVLLYLLLEHCTSASTTTSNPPTSSPSAQDAAAYLVHLLVSRLLLAAPHLCVPVFRRLRNPVVLTKACEGVVRSQLPHSHLHSDISSKSPKRAGTPTSSSEVEREGAVLQTDALMCLLHTVESIFSPSTSFAASLNQDQAKLTMMPEQREPGTDHPNEDENEEKDREDNEAHTASLIAYVPCTPPSPSLLSSISTAEGVRPTDTDYPDYLGDLRRRTPVTSSAHLLVQTLCNATYRLQRLQRRQERLQATGIRTQKKATMKKNHKHQNKNRPYDEELDDEDDTEGDKEDSNPYRRELSLQVKMQKQIVVLVAVLRALGNLVHLQEAAKHSAWTTQATQVHLCVDPTADLVDDEDEEEAKAMGNDASNSRQQQNKQQTVVTGPDLSPYEDVPPDQRHHGAYLRHSDSRGQSGVANGSAAVGSDNKTNATSYATRRKRGKGSLLGQSLVALLRCCTSSLRIHFTPSTISASSVVVPASHDTPSGSVASNKRLRLQQATRASAFVDAYIRDFQTLTQTDAARNLVDAGHSLSEHSHQTKSHPPQKDDEEAVDQRSSPLNSSATLASASVATRASIQMHQLSSFVGADAEASAVREIVQQAPDSHFARYLQQHQHASATSSMNSSDPRSLGQSSQSAQEEEDFQEERRLTAHELRQHVHLLLRETLWTLSQLLPTSAPPTAAPSSTTATAGNPDTEVPVQATTTENSPSNNDNVMNTNGPSQPQHHHRNLVPAILQQLMQDEALGEVLLEILDTHALRALGSSHLNHATGAMAQAQTTTSSSSPHIPSSSTATGGVDGGALLLHSWLLVSSKLLALDYDPVTASYSSRGTNSTQGSAAGGGRGGGGAVAKRLVALGLCEKLSRLMDLHAGASEPVSTSAPVTHLRALVPQTMTQSMQVAPKYTQNTSVSILPHTGQVQGRLLGSAPTNSSSTSAWNAQMPHPHTQNQPNTQFYADTQPSQTFLAAASSNPAGATTPSPSTKLRLSSMLPRAVFEALVATLLHLLHSADPLTTAPHRRLLRHPGAGLETFLKTHWHRHCLSSASSGDSGARSHVHVLGNTADDRSGIQQSAHWSHFYAASSSTSSLTQATTDNDGSGTTKKMKRARRCVSCAMLCLLCEKLLSLDAEYPANQYLPDSDDALDNHMDHPSDTSVAALDESPYGPVHNHLTTARNHQHPPAHHLPSHQLVSSEHSVVSDQGVHQTADGASRRSLDMSSAVRHMTLTTSQQQYRSLLVRLRHAQVARCLVSAPQIRHHYHDETIAGDQTRKDGHQEMLSNTTKSGVRTKSSSKNNDDNDEGLEWLLDETSVSHDDTIIGCDRCVEVPLNVTRRTFDHATRSLFGRFHVPYGPTQFS